MYGKLIPYAVMSVATGIALWRGAPYANVAFIVFMAAWYTIRTWLTDPKPPEVIQERDRSRERLLAGAFGIGMVVIPLVTLTTPILDFAAYRALPAQYLFGGISAIAGLFVFYRSHADLGSFWSAHLELREGHTLVTQGIYGQMRHPMYTAIFLITLAQALLLTNWLAGPAGIAFFGLLYAFRVGPEEQMMADQFGADWEAYASRTPRLWPRIRA